MVLLISFPLVMLKCFSGWNEQQYSDSLLSSNFYRHVRSHGKKQEAGDQCSKVFVTKDHLTKHMNSVHTENNIKCQDCDKVFKTQTHLNNHNLVHNDKQLSCISCGRLYKNSRTLKKHSCNDKLDISNANQQNKPDKKKHENWFLSSQSLLENRICATKCLN